MAKVLIVEDEIICALYLEHLVKSMGHVVLKTMAEGENAILSARDDEPDLILMDIMLKGALDGVEAVKRIHRHKKIPVIYITASTDSGTFKRAGETSPVGFLRKPFREEDLEEKVKVALQSPRN
ncbi:MAG: response regulator [bacterium]|nr:response regulator [bacterium]